MDKYIPWHDGQKREQTTKDEDDKEFTMPII